MQKPLHLELDDLEEIAGLTRGAGAYSRDYVTLARQGRLHWMQGFGSPALVWHVGFRPRRTYDPQVLAETRREPGLPEGRYAAEQRRREFIEDFNTLLARLQHRGRVGGKVERFAIPAAPNDTENAHSAGATATFLPLEPIGFTMWWSDDPSRAKCPDAPPPEDLRVQVLAQIHGEFATITFTIDPGKSWNRPPLDETAGGVVGARRARIYEASELIRNSAERRLAADPDGHLDLLPETGVSAEEAQRLLDAANLMYRQIWKDFADVFDCRSDNIAGETCRIFADLRGLVLEETGPAGSRSRKRRFGAHPDAANAGAVTKAYWPFLRRTRVEADQREWVGSSVFDGQALYISALPERGDFDPRDEEQGWSPVDVGGDTTTDVPAGFVPTRGGGRPSLSAIQERLDNILSRELGARLQERVRKIRDAATARKLAEGARPEPWQYLLLTCGTQPRREFARMAGTINLLETLRPAALRNLSAIRDADEYLGMVGQLHDRTMDRVTANVESVVRAWWHHAYGHASASLASLGPKLGALTGGASMYLRTAYEECFATVRSEIMKLEAGEAASERSLALYRRLLADIIADVPAGLEGEKAHLIAEARSLLAEMRKAEVRHDADLAQIYREAERELMRLQALTNSLGSDVSGGLALRINRCGHFADRFRTVLGELGAQRVEGLWDYARFVAAGIEPQFEFIEGVGKRLENVQGRLRDSMEVMRTEATRGNTSQLVAVSEATAVSTERLISVVGEIGALAHAMEKREKRFGTTRWIYTLLLIGVAAFGLGLAIFALLSGKCGIPLKLGPVSITWPC